MNGKTAELIAIREKRIEGVLIRSKARWIANGEKVTSYFCSLEKRHNISFLKRRKEERPSLLIKTTMH